MKTRTLTALLAATAFALSALDVPPPTSDLDGWMRADVQARLPAAVVMVSDPVLLPEGIALAVLPGPSCELALASLRSDYRLRLNGRPIDGSGMRRACGVAQVHRIEVRT